MSLEDSPLFLDDSFVLVQELPDLQVASFDCELNTIGILRSTRVVDAVLDEKGIFA